VAAPHCIPWSRNPNRPAAGRSNDTPFAERDTVELVEHRFVEALADAVGLRALGLGARMIDVLDGEVELVFVSFGIAAVLAAAVGQHAQELDIVAVEERDHPIIEQIGRRDRRLAIVQLGASHLGVGVDEGLLIDAPNALQVADIERILGAAIARMLALELAVGFLLGLGLSSATTCASVSTKLLASSALSRLFMVSRSWRSHTQRTPAGVRRA
jgi:hypothetical protein